MSATVIRIEPAQGHSVHVEAPTQPLWTPSLNGTKPTPSVEALTGLVRSGQAAERAISTLKVEYLNLLRLNVRNGQAMVGRVRLRLEEYDSETEHLCADMASKARAARARLGGARRDFDDARDRGSEYVGPNLEIVERELSDVETVDRSLVANRLLSREATEDTFFRAVHAAVHCSERLWELVESQLLPLEAIVTGGKRAAEMIEHLRTAPGVESQGTEPTQATH